MKKIVRLTESDLNNIIKESVGKILKETSDDYDSNLDEGQERPYLSHHHINSNLRSFER